jgi:hypothetical protein
MQVRTCVVPPLAVDFALCDERPLVFLKRMKLVTRPQT